MAKKIKKQTLKDLREEIDDASSTVADGILEVEEKAAVKVVEAVENVEEKVEDAAVEVKKERPWSKFASLKHFKKIGFASILLVAVGGVGASVYFYSQYSKTQVLGTQNDFSEVKSVVEDVATHMELPTEEPSVATVSDTEKLKNQPFFANAQNGDKVLIYQSSKKVILYRPSIDKIIEVAVLNLGDAVAVNQNPLIATGGATVTPTEASKTATVIILNGTTATGLTRRAEPLISDISGIEIIGRDNAQKNDYGKTIVINAGNAPAATVTAIAGMLNATVETLPETEAREGADIIVILGSDFIK